MFPRRYATVIIPILSFAIEVMASIAKCFETLCGVRLVSELVRKIPKLQLSKLMIL